VFGVIGLFNKTLQQVISRRQMTLVKVQTLKGVFYFIFPNQTHMSCLVQAGQTCSKTTTEIKICC